MTKCGVMVLLSNKCVWKTRNPHQSRLPDGPILPQTDSGHFAVATLGSYPATISCTTRVLRHVLANALCDITSLINEDGAKYRLRGFTPRNRIAPYEERSDEVRGKVTTPVKQGAKYRLRGLTPRNMVAPYEMRSSEVRGNGFVIK